MHRRLSLQAGVTLCITLTLFYLLLYINNREAPSKLKSFVLRSPKILNGSTIGKSAINKRVLYMTASYTLKQYDSLCQSLISLVDLCNIGLNISIHLHASNGLHVRHKLFQELSKKLFCNRSGRFIPIMLFTYGKIGFGLTHKHRSNVLRYLSEFDYFIYAEEDMILTQENFIAYQQTKESLRTLFPNSYLRVVPGFIRLSFYCSVRSKINVTKEYFF